MKMTSRVKYPRTYHLPWSPGMTDDDRMMEDVAFFTGQRVVVTAKLDGENTTLYTDYVHARSLEFQPHPSRDRVKALHGTVGYEIPKGWRVCGENLFAKHAIHYHRLPAYFLVFSIWNERNVCLGWDDTLVWVQLLDLKTVPILYDGIWDEDLIRKLYTPTLDGDECEGYVVRVASEFHHRDFRRRVGKYVRASHVSVDGGHWMNKIVISNEISER